MLRDLDFEIQDHVNADVKGLFPYPANRDETEYSRDDEYEIFTDEFGITWRKPVSCWIRSWR